MYSFLLIVVSSILGVSGQIFLKLGVESRGAIRLSDPAVIFQSVIQVFTAPFIWVGLACYGLATVVWIIVLSRLDVSLAYPLIALNFVLVPILGWFFLGEQIPSGRWIGVMVILVGVTIISRT